MSPHLSQETKALLHAADALTTEVRRIADALTTPTTDREDEWTGSLIPPVLAEVIAADETKTAAATAGPLRDQIADAIGNTNLPMWHKEHRYEAADAVLAVILPTTKLLGDLHRSAHEDLQRVTALYERWMKSPMLLGVTDVYRWWDDRLAELHAAIDLPEQAEDPT